MRKINKFKNFSNLNVPTRKLPNKLAQFYKSKWYNIKLSLEKNKGNDIKYINPAIRKVSFRFIQRLSKNYKSKLEVKKNLLSLFDDSIKHNSTKSTNKSDLVVKNKLVVPLYKIDVLLWYLNLFASVYMVRQFINSGYIKVNEKVITQNYSLKKGDVITFDFALINSYKSLTNNISNIYLDNIIFLTFIETDFYTKTFTVVKDINDLSEEDYKLLIDSYIEIYKIS